MTVDLWMLAAAVLLTWLQIMLAATPPLLADMKWAVGNRDQAAARAGWAARADRAAQNMKENLPLFAALVLVVHVSGSNDATTALGAQVFVVARLLHAAAYLAGIPGLRTVLWAVSIAGMVMVASGLF